MSWKKISLEDKNRIDSYFKLRKCELSDFTFTNLYIWQFAREITYKIVDDFLVIRTKYQDKNPYIFTPFGSGDLGALLEKLASEFRRDGFPLEIRSVSDAQKELLQSVRSDLEFVENRDRFDYIYSINELIELKGRKFHDKKNHLNRFKELYSYRYEPISMENIEELKNVWKSWFAKIEARASIGLKMEFFGIEELFRHYGALNIKGAIIRVNDKIVAFTLGESLNDETVVIHTEKADTDYHGAYQIINQQFLENEWSCFKNVNREEDLGIAGLRKAKLSYNPTYLAKKYETTIS